MEWSDATKKQLLAIVFHDDCPLEYKYECVRELQLKRWSSTFLQKLLKYWGMGLTEVQIADKFGVEVWEITNQLQINNLHGSRVKRRMAK